MNRPFHRLILLAAAAIAVTAVVIWKVRTAGSDGRTVPPPAVSLTGDAPAAADRGRSDRAPNAAERQRPAPTDATRREQQRRTEADQRAAQPASTAAARQETPPPTEPAPPRANSANGAGSATTPRAPAAPRSQPPAATGALPVESADPSPARPPAADQRAGGSAEASISDGAGQLVMQGLARLDGGDPLAGRRLLSEALRTGTLSEADAAAVRQRLAQLNQKLVFGAESVEGDPFVRHHMVASGDTLERIVRQKSLQVDWRFIQRINGIPQPHLIRVGQRIKLVTGPFHAVIDKSDFRMDIYLGDEELVYVRSVDVGLGEHDSTPTGMFRIRPQSKLIDPEWVNPRTRERYAATDPANPIGERWMGLEGIDGHNSALQGYGIHGTIEPDSIGRQASMGCVRLHHDDVVLIYELLTEGVSRVQIME